MKLNGWQRLWILVGILWFATVCFGVWGLFLSNLDDQRERALVKRTRETLLLVIDEKKFEAKPTEVADEIIKRIKNGNFTPEGRDESLTLEELIDHTHKKNSETDFSKVEKAYSDQLDEIGSKKIKAILVGLSAWFIPLILLYGFGWLIGWVMRGFKKQES